MEFTYTNTMTVWQYNSLRTSVGWYEVQEEPAEKGLKNSVLIALADASGPFGMARLVTDYSYTVLIVDVIVRPDYQGKGYGRVLMTKVMEYVRDNISPGQKKIVNLMAGCGKEDFYKKFGFIKRPNDIQGAGMTQWVSKDA